MAGRFDFYFKQQVTESELDAAFEALELSQRQLIADQALFGISAGGALTQTTPVANLTVQASGPCYGYDQLGQRLYFAGPSQTIDCSVDANAVTTSVAASGNEKWLTIFLKFKRILSDERIDGNSQPVFFRRDESYSLVVVQGAEAVIGGASKPALDPTMIILGDINLRWHQSQILSANINVDRRGDTYVLNGPPGGASVRAGSAHDAILGMLGALNNHIIGVSGVPGHPALAISTTDGPVWLDAKQNLAADVQTQLNKIVSDLKGTASGDDGAMKIGARARAGTIFSYSAGSLRSILEAIASQLDTLSVGVTRVAYVADVTALRALTTHVQTSVAIVAGEGIYHFFPSLSTADDGLHIIRPTDVLSGSPGRWVSPLGVEIGVALGIAQLDATARVAAANVRNGIIATVGSTFGTAGSTYATITASTFADLASIAGVTAAAGDVLMVAASCMIFSGSSGGTLQLVVTDGSGTTIVQDTQFQAGSIAGYPFVGRYVVPSGHAGTQTVKLQWKSIGGATQQALGTISIDAIQIRP